MFDQTKNLVTTAPHLAMLDLAEETVELTLNTDASLVGAGGVVLANVAGEKKPVAYYSRKFTDTEKHCSTTDRKMLSAIDYL